MKPLRVGLFTDTFLPDHNGIVTSVLLLSDELRALGHHVEVVAPAFPNHADCRSDVRRVNSVKYPFLPTYRLAWPTRKNFERKYDVVHTHTPLTLGMAGARLARKWNVPLVTTYHTHLAAYTHYVPGLSTVDKVAKVMPRISSMVYSRAHAVITPTAGMLDVLREAGVRNPVVIPTSIDPKPLQAAPAVQSPWPEGKRRLITVGRLAREKRFDLVLDAVAQMPDTYLVALGEGPERANLEQHAERLGISDRVQFLGVRPWTEIGAYYRLAEAFVFASDTETQGLVLQEAQLMGVPVVAVGARGTLSGVSNGYSGYLVEPGDVAGLVKHTQSLMADHHQRERFSEQAKEFAGRTTPRGVAKQVADVYARTLGLPLTFSEFVAPTPATHQNIPVYDR